MEHAPDGPTDGQVALEALWPLRITTVSTPDAGHIAATHLGWLAPKGGAIMATGEAKVIDNAIMGFMRRRQCSHTPI